MALRPQARLGGHGTTLSFQILNIEAIEAIGGAKVSLQCVYTERTWNESGAFSARRWGMDAWAVMRVMEEAVP